MNGRVVLSLVGLGVIVTAFYLIFEYPEYANYAFYLLISWMVLNFVLLYAIRPRGPLAPSEASPDPSPFPSQTSSAPTSPSNASGSGSSLGFCIYCATPVPPGTRACPSCGHVLPQW